MKLNYTGDGVKTVTTFTLLIIAVSLCTGVAAEEDQKPLYLFRSTRVSHWVTPMKRLLMIFTLCIIIQLV